jgi:hypothetical protein
MKFASCQNQLIPDPSRGTGESKTGAFTLSIHRGFRTGYRRQRCAIR